MQLRRSLLPRPKTAALVGVLLTALAIAVFSRPAVSHAATPTELQAARTLFEQAEQDEAAGRWSEALDKLERVAAVKETAGVRFHIATCQEQLGALVRALESYERAKQLAIETSADDVLELAGPEIVRLRSIVATVQFEEPAGLGPFAVYVDGEAVSDRAAGAALRLDPGPHRIVVKVGGETLLDRRVTLSRGGTETLTLTKPDARPPAPAQEERRQPAPIASVAGSSVPTAGILAFGLGAAFGVGGYLAYAKADALADESARVCGASLSCDPARAEQVRRWDAAALGLWVGAAAGVGVGVALTVGGGASDEPSTALLLEPTRVNLRTTF